MSEGRADRVFGTAAAEVKRVMRAELRVRRRQHAGVRGHGDAEALAAAVLALPEVSAAGVVAAYLSRPGEPGTAPLLIALADRGARVLLPVVLDDRDLDWAADDGTRAGGLLPGLAEPGGARLGRAAVALADVLVVPALTVDATGHRLGQGGGSYDRALGRRRPGSLVVALVHDHELVPGPLPSEQHDVSVDVTVTPRRVVRTPQA